VLVAADESPASLAAVRALRQAGYRPWVSVSERGTYAARSRDAAGWFPVPSPNLEPEEFARALARVAAGVGAAAILPASEASLRALTGREAMFPDGVVVGTAGEEALDRATDKTALAAFAASAGLATPRSRELRADEVDGVGEVELPALVKPIRTVVPVDEGRLQRAHVRLVRDVSALREAVAGAPGGHVIVQQLVRGPLAAITGVSWEGKLVCAVHQQAHRIWPPELGVTSFGETVARDDELEASVARLLGVLGWSGIFQTQFIQSGGRPLLIDFNPRIYGSLGLAVAAGANLPAIWLDLLLGRPPAIARYRPGVRYRVEEDDLRALAAAFRRGERSAALAGLIPRRRTAHAVLSLRDPAPTLVAFDKLIRRVGRIRS
jgi:predicted ATP-grasp superfamily ATP-dependent carboligase